MVRIAEGGKRGALFAIGALALAAVVLELGARLYLRYVASPDRFLKSDCISQLETRADALPRLSPHRYLGYAPTPGYSRGPNRHNALGFRGAEVAVPKPPTAYRIVCLGGSTTYGDGVEDWHFTYPALLQDCDALIHLAPHLALVPSLRAQGLPLGGDLGGHSIRPSIGARVS